MKNKNILSNKQNQFSIYLKLHKQNMKHESSNLRHVLIEWIIQNKVKNYSFVNVIGSFKQIHCNFLWNIYIYEKFPTDETVNFTISWTNFSRRMKNTTNVHVPSTKITTVRFSVHSLKLSIDSNVEESPIMLT